MDDDTKPATITHEQLKQLVATLAAEMRAASASLSGESLSGTGGGSRQRGLPEDLRARFVDVRTALFQRGLFDPVLVRFDTATGNQASAAEIAEQLAKVADAL